MIFTINIIKLQALLKRSNWNLILREDLYMYRGRELGTVFKNSNERGWSGGTSASLDRPYGSPSQVQFLSS